MLLFCSPGVFQLVKSGLVFPEAELRPLVAQIAQGLAHVHKSKLVHRDLAARNILLSVDHDTGAYIPKIADFGMSRVLAADMEKGHTKSTFGPVPWMVRYPDCPRSSLVFLTQSSRRRRRLLHRFNIPLLLTCGPLA